MKPFKIISMENLQLTKSQLQETNDLIKKTIDDISKNIDYNLDYIKFYIHPETKSDIYVKIRTFGASGGQPFFEIVFMVIAPNSFAEKFNFKGNYEQKNKFLIALKEIKFTDNGKVTLI